MAEEMPEGSLREWMAAESLDPPSGETIIEVLKIGFAALCAAHGMKVDQSMFDPRPDRREEHTASPEEAVRIAKASGGVPPCQP